MGSKKSKLRKAEHEERVRKSIAERPKNDAHAHFNKIIKHSPEGLIPITYEDIEIMAAKASAIKPETNKFAREFWNDMRSKVLDPETRAIVTSDYTQALSTLTSLSDEDEKTCYFTSLSDEDVRVYAGVEAESYASTLPFLEELVRRKLDVPLVCVKTIFLYLNHHSITSTSDVWDALIYRSKSSENLSNYKQYVNPVQPTLPNGKCVESLWKYGEFDRRMHLLGKITDFDNDFYLSTKEKFYDGVLGWGVDEYVRYLYQYDIKMRTHIWDMSSGKLRTKLLELTTV